MSEKNDLINLENSFVTQVTMLNVVAEARYDMPLVSQKLFIEALSRVDIDRDDFSVIRIGLSEFAKRNNVNKDYLYREKENITSKTLTAQIMIKDLDTDSYTQKNLFSQCSYKDGQFIFEFSEKMKPYFLDIYSKGGYYFKFIKEYISRFKCKYTMKLYLLCQSNLYKCQRNQEVSFSLDTLKSFYDIKGGKYSSYRNFNERVLKPAFEEINEKTDLNVEYIPVRTSGRNIDKIIFNIVSKKLLENAKYTVTDSTFNNFLDFINYDKDEDKNINNKVEMFKNWQENYDIYLIFYVSEKAKKLANKNIFSYIDVSLKNTYLKGYNVYESLFGKHEEQTYIMTNSETESFGDNMYIDYLSKFDKYIADNENTAQDIYNNWRKNVRKSFDNALKFCNDIMVSIDEEDENIILNVRDRIKQNDIMSNEFFEVYTDITSKVNYIKDYISKSGMNIKEGKEFLNGISMDILDPTLEDVYFKIISLNEKEKKMKKKKLSKV